MAADVLGIIAPHPPIMVPDVGGTKAAATSASIEAMREAARALSRFAADTLVIISPHSPGLADAFAVETTPRSGGTLSEFGAPQTRISVATDVEFALRLLNRLETTGIPVVSRAMHPGLRPGVLDHGVLVPLSFLDPGGASRVVTLSPSGVSRDLHRRLGSAVAEVAESLGRRLAFLASGDLSHRLRPGAPAGYSLHAAEFDRQVVTLLQGGDLDAVSRIDADLADEAGECGLRSLIALSGVLSDPAIRVLSYEAPWGVGYLTALAGRPEDLGPWESPQPDSGRKGGMPGDAREHEVVRLARRAIASFVMNGVRLDPLPLADPALPRRAGVFVTLYLDGRLRGCIGTILPAYEDLADEVASNAVKAATADPRFAAITADDVDRLEVKVDVLHPPEGCTADALDPATFGVIVTSGCRQGLLLPDIEGVDSPAAQLDIARRKAGIGSSEPCDLERFRVDRYT